MSFATFSADVKTPSLLIIRMRPTSEYIVISEACLGRVVEGSINRVEIKVPHFLEEFGVNVVT